MELPPLHFTGGAAAPSNATGGYASAAWDQGDLVVNYGDGGSAGGRSVLGGASAPLGIGWGTWALCAAAIGGVLLWKRSK